MTTAAPPSKFDIIYRHPWPVRLWHWTSACVIGLLLMTGALIFNVHPRLYWGDDGHEGMPAIASLSSPDTQAKPPRFDLRIGPLHANVTGKMGLIDNEGSDTYVLFAAPPADFQFGATRIWHFAFAWILVASTIAYGIYLLLSGRFRALWLPTRQDLALANVRHEAWQHMRLRRAHGAAMRRYNVLQKASYMAIGFVVVPVLVLSGLTMSNSVTAVFPSLFALFGGRQSARTLHFIAASALLLFIVVHVIQVFAGGFLNLLGSMITGRYRVEREEP